MKRLIARESVQAVLEELSKQSKECLDDIERQSSKEDKQAFLTFTNTLLDAEDTLFKYLPQGERCRICTLCANFMDIGLIFGRSPRALADILKITQANIVHKEGTRPCKSDANEKGKGEGEHGSDQPPLPI